MKLLFLDVEATGTEEEDRLLQVAYRYKTDDANYSVNQYYKPPVPIKKEAMAIHHVTEKMVADKPAFLKSDEQIELQELAKEGQVLVAHNAKYDMGMLAKEDVHFNSHICTLKVARYVDAGSMSNHQLQYLRYFYDLEVDLGELAPHDALADILVLEEVARKLSYEVAKKDGVEGVDIIKRMVEISELPSLINKFTFGKHNGKTVAQVAEETPDYLEWLLKQKMQAPENEEDWIHTLHYHLNNY